MGALSLMGFEERKQPFRPLIPDVRFIEFNNEADLEKITSKTAGVILETIQGGAGFIEPKNNYLKKVQERCEAVGAVFILDEIQPGIGRTGKLFGFQHYQCTPDILVTGKGLGGGLPIGAFTASCEMMATLKDNPKLGHITTFGGNPVIAAAALATLQEITQTNLIPETLEKEALLRQHLQHELISEIRGKGLMLAAILPSAEITNRVVLKCQDHGLILFWLLFEPKAIRITPPLTISNDEIIEGCAIIMAILNDIDA
jgi:acetylornithine aminotransferase